MQLLKSRPHVYRHVLHTSRDLVRTSMQLYPHGWSEQSMRTIKVCLAATVCSPVPYAQALAATRTERTGGTLLGPLGNR